MELSDEEIQYVKKMKPGQQYRHYYEDENRRIEIKKVGPGRYGFRFCGANRTIFKENNVTIETLAVKWMVFLHGIACDDAKRKAGV